MLNIYIEQITHELTWRLRQQVLYPDSTISEMAISEDEEGIHYGAFLENRLVAVVSTFRQGDDIQLRKLAVDLLFQHKGVGSRLLEYVTDRATEDGIIRLWCNARVPAINFYLKNGFNSTAETFTRNNIDYEIMEKRL